MKHQFPLDPQHQFTLRDFFHSLMFLNQPQMKNSHMQFKLCAATLDCCSCRIHFHIAMYVESLQPLKTLNSPAESLDATYSFNKSKNLVNLTIRCYVCYFSPQEPFSINFLTQLKLQSKHIHNHKAPLTTVYVQSDLVLHSAFVRSTVSFIPQRMENFTYDSYAVTNNHYVGRLTLQQGRKGNLA